MDAFAAIEQRIEEGFVFDERGRWMHMAELRIYEKRLIDQLVRGNVLVGGKWIPVAEAAAQARARTAPPPIAPVQTPKTLIQIPQITVQVPQVQVQIPQPSIPIQTSQAPVQATQTPVSIQTPQAPIQTPQPPVQDSHPPVPLLSASELLSQGKTEAGPPDDADNMLETVCISMPAVPPQAVKTPDSADKAIAGLDSSYSDDLRETTCLTVEAVKPETPIPAFPTEARIPAKPPEAKAAANPQEAKTASNAGEEIVDGVLLFGLSKSAAAEQSKYAVEYIEEFNNVRKRKGLFSGLAIASLSLAAAAAAAIIILQYLGF